MGSPGRGGPVWVRTPAPPAPASSWRGVWAGPGRAEPIRLAFAVHKVPFEDAILTGDAWSSLKPETPWGQVPVLEVDGKMLAQSRTIMAYVGRVTGLHPEDPFAAAKVDEFCDTVEECVAVCLAASFGKDVRQPPLTRTLAVASLRPARRLLLGLRCRPDSLPVAQGEDKLAARKRLAAPGSKLHEWLGKVDAALGAWAHDGSLAQQAAGVTCPRCTYVNDPRAVEASHQCFMCQFRGPPFSRHSGSASGGGGGGGGLLYTLPLEQLAAWDWTGAAGAAPVPAVSIPAPAGVPGSGCFAPRS